MATEATPQLQWTGQFAASPSTKLPGDKIVLPQSALEQLLAASSSTAASNNESQHFDAYNQYWRIAARQVESQFSDQKNALPHPLTFRLVNPQNGRVVYAGIREFSAEEGEAVLSAFLWQALGLKEEEREQAAEDSIAQITIHARQLPKGTYVKLRPLEAGYDPEDWKALLERHLRLNYTTLTNGEVLVASGGRGVGGKNEEFRFLVDGFKPVSEAICVVDTDLEVDIEALNEEQARETIKMIAAKMQRAPGTGQGSSAGGDIDMFKPIEGQILPGEYVDYQLESWPKGQPLDIELEGADTDDDVDLLVSPVSTRQRVRPRLDEHVFADFGTNGERKIRLEPINIELENAEALWITVHAFSPNNESDPTPDTQLRHYTLRIRTADAKSTRNGIKNTDAAAEQLPNPGDIRCKNCLQWVPERTLMLHENFCLRNNIVCPHGCNQVFQKRSPDFQSHWHCPHDTFYGNTTLSQEKHNALYHPDTPLPCHHCSTTHTFPSIPLLAQHRTSTCPAKLILCRFCHLEMPQEGDPDTPNAEALLSGMTPHELADGARTTECHLCARIVKLKDMTIHLRNHDMERKTRPAPRLCRNINCGRTLDGCNHAGDTRSATKMGQGPGNDIALCSTCFGPLYVSLYDPENKALRRRIERRYLQQLLTGCGKNWCRNTMCKTGRTNLTIEPASVTTKDALPLIKPFVDGSIEPTQVTELHFCVDEQSQKRKVLAGLLTEERGLKGEQYSLPWVVGALEAEAGDVDKARAWLSNWAPTTSQEDGTS
ncbi:ubiquitin fusion degradation protein UFD1-domain-containing protein [Delphinella strobiligena]|nr:ubiquitin fusion degradation protein UFD1-domain-containing protein [Delphinella strobiligena]